MQDRSPLTCRNLLATHGRTIHLGQAMNQPVSQSASVTHHLGAIIGLFTLVAINLACIGSFVLGWW